MAAFTAKDLAEKIAPSAEDVPSTIERIRHWTREGLLTPVGERNPGTGHKRRYDEEAVHTSLILNELAKWGVGIGQTNQAFFHAAFLLAKEAAKTIKQKELEGVVIFLSINRGSSLGNPVAYLTEIRNYKVPVEGADGTVKYLVLCDRMPIQVQAESAIVINLTRLLA